MEFEVRDLVGLKRFTAGLGRHSGGAMEDATNNMGMKGLRDTVGFSVRGCGQRHRDVHLRGYDDGMGPSSVIAAT